MELKENIEILRSQLDEMVCDWKEYNKGEMLYVSKKLDKLIDMYYREKLYNDFEEV